MGKITNEKEYIQIEIDPEQIVFRAVPLKDANMSFGDLIGIAAWLMLRQHAPKFVKNREFRFRSADVVDGKFVVTFHEELPEERKAPPLP